MTIARAALLLGCVALIPVPAAGGQLRLSVADAQWGGTDTAQIEVVLREALDEVRALFAGIPAMQAVVSPTFGPPMLLFQRAEDGRHQMLLNARGDDWAAYAYEFTHELVHLVTHQQNGSVLTPNVRHQWFEEAVCEAVSMFVLRRLASRPESPRSASYRSLLERLMAEPLRQAAYAIDLRRWILEYEPTLRDQPYRRDLNALVAVRILALLEQDPQGLLALRHLHPARRARPESFPAFMQHWCRESMPAAQAFVRAALSLFGIDDPGRRPPGPSSPADGYPRQASQ